MSAHVWHLPGAYACSGVREFLIHSTFVLVFSYVMGNLPFLAARLMISLVLIRLCVLYSLLRDKA